MPKGRVHLLRQKLLWDSACHEELQLTNHGLGRCSCAWSCKLAADYADLFEVRGMQRARRGHLVAAGGGRARS